LKPVDRVRLRETLNRAHERLDRSDFRDSEATHLRAAVEVYEATTRSYFERIPVRDKDEIIIVPVRDIVSVVADGELLTITTSHNERYSINYRLKELEARLDPRTFVRLSRGTIANIEMIRRINALPGGTYVVTMSNDQQLQVSRLQSRLLRDGLLRL
jgi:DNA-binding LytR/AlgR family response regulator